ncbi:hypothetical protein I3842_05G131200 [Carya illinoinensis]|uniref:Uncharacterized protein n=1 Tax=Carya illinoinensis TaxID=32201 RepID=A0A922F430_CARIL|nr:hypothetical protein I3842_05G131200 [Carya illinoinensis]
MILKTLRSVHLPRTLHKTGYNSGKVVFCPIQRLPRDGQFRRFIIEGSMKLSDKDKNYYLLCSTYISLI